MLQTIKSAVLEAIDQNPDEIFSNGQLRAYLLANYDYDCKIQEMSDFLRHNANVGRITQVSHGNYTAAE